MIEFDGVFPAVVTPFDDGGAFAPDPFERLLDRLYEAGVHGVYVGGTTGEGAAQSVEQRKRVIEAAVRSTPPERSVIAHVGSSSLAETLELARYAASVGASAISSLPPLGPYAYREVADFYAALAAAAELPLFLYYFPALSRAVETLDQLRELCSLPDVVGVKFTDFDLYTLGELRREGHVVFNGRDEVFAAGMLMGANGGIGTFYNLMPEQFVRVYTLARAGQWEEARATQREINKVIRTTLRYPIFPAVKTILSWTGIECGPCLPPRRPLTPEESEALRAELGDTCLGPVLERGAIEPAVR